MDEFPRNINELEARFSNEEACRGYLFRLRWPDGFRCPRCGGKKAWPGHGFSALPGSVIHTDGWPGYSGVAAKGYVHKVTVLTHKKQPPSELMPLVHIVASLLKRWLLGTHQGAVSREHLDYYLDEFTFRFNRRNSKTRGKLFYRLLQQAVAVEPVPYKAMVKCYETGDENHNW